MQMINDFIDYELLPTLTQSIFDEVIGPFIDLRLLRTIIEAFVKPKAGTLKIKSFRYLLMEAGKGKAVVPSRAYTATGFQYQLDQDQSEARQVSELMQVLPCIIDKWFETLLGKDIFGYPKPESLVAYLIEISTNEGDLVMDFFAGSGTTLAVAHKMNRRYVGIEQMDYIESITKERLKKVVSGEQGGVSKTLNFKGGGSFLYAELMPLNALYKEEIAKLDSGEVSHNELEKLYKDLESKAFLDYRYDIQEILKDRDFHALNLEEKKCVLYQILDSNMDYVLLSELGDSSLEIDEQTKELNKIFFNMKGKENECANR